MQHSGNGMTARVLELAQVLKDINHGESIVESLHTTGEPRGLPSVDVLEGLLNEAKACYTQKLRTLSQDELRALGTLV